MIKNIIFDFGDVFMNLDKNATPNALQKLGLLWDDDWKKVDTQLETGQISPDAFLKKLSNALPQATTLDILNAWNAVMVDFPAYRLDFLKTLTPKYRLFLLSNTDYIHFKAFEKRCGDTFAKEFYNCFEATYYSYALKVKKPQKEGFEFVIQKHQLQPAETLFIDDNVANTNTAKLLGLHVWNLQVGKEDVVDLFTKGLPLG